MYKNIFNVMKILCTRLNASLCLWQSNVNVNFMKTHENLSESKKANIIDVDLPNLESELRDYVIKQEVCLYVCGAKYGSLVSGNHLMHSVIA